MKYIMQCLLIMFLIVQIVRSSNNYDKTITFVCLRHGQSTWNAKVGSNAGLIKKIVHAPFADCDAPLTPKGIEECEGWSLKTVFDKVEKEYQKSLPESIKYFSSPLSRAFQSLKSAFGNDMNDKNVNILAGLQETSDGIDAESSTLGQCDQEITFPSSPHEKCEVDLQIYGVYPTDKKSRPDCPILKTINTDFQYQCKERNTTYNSEDQCKSDKNRGKCDHLMHTINQIFDEFKDDPSNAGTAVIGGHSLWFTKLAKCMMNGRSEIYNQKTKNFHKMYSNHENHTKYWNHYVDKNNRLQNGEIGVFTVTRYSDGYLKFGSVARMEKPKEIEKNM